MVKVMRSFTLDSDVVEQLSKADNASGLINKLVREYYEETTSNDPKVLLNKKLEFESEIDIFKRKLEHVNDKLILLNNKKKEETQSLEYQQAMKDFNKKLEEIKARWQNDEITEEEYWKEMDEMKKQKPSK